MLLNTETSLLVMIDAQEKLVPAINNNDALTRHMKTLAKAAARLEVPIFVTEQNPDGLGPTLAGLKEAAGAAATYFTKSDFSSTRDKTFHEALQAPLSQGRQQIILSGVEAHICVLQTALGLCDLKAGFPDVEIFVVADAVGSRQPTSLEAALARLSGAGVQLVTSEMVLFEWLGASTHPAFKELRKLIL